jgi:hypothetical protein
VSTYHGVVPGWKVFFFQGRRNTQAQGKVVEPIPSQSVPLKEATAKTTETAAPQEEETAAPKEQKVLVQETTPEEEEEEQPNPVERTTSTTQNEETK